VQLFACVLLLDGRFVICDALTGMTNSVANSSTQLLVELLDDADGAADDGDVQFADGDPNDKQKNSQGGSDASNKDSKTAKSPTNGKKTEVSKEQPAKTQANNGESKTQTNTDAKENANPSQNNASKQQPKGNTSSDDSSNEPDQTDTEEDEEEDPQTDKKIKKRDTWLRVTQWDDELEQDSVKVRKAISDRLMKFFAARVALVLLVLGCVGGIELVFHGEARVLKFLTVILYFVILVAIVEALVSYSL